MPAADPQGAGGDPQPLVMRESSIAALALNPPPRHDVLLGAGGVLTEVTVAGTPVASWRLV